jgi:hypothetical protein
MISTLKSLYGDLRARSLAWLREEDHVAERQRRIAASDKALHRQQSLSPSDEPEAEAADRKRRIAASDQVLALHPENPVESTAPRRREDEPGS